MSGLLYRDSREVLYGARDYFDMVLDVDRYEDFLPYCAASRVLERCGEGEILARMVLVFGGVRQSYTSCVRMWEEEGGILRIGVSQHGKGPFLILRNEWRFSPLEGGGCRIDFELEMKLKSILLEKLVFGMVDGLGGRMVEAFELRALALYGRQKGGCQA